MGKYKDIKIEMDGKEIKDSSKNYVKISDGIFELHGKEIYLEFEIGNYKEDGCEIGDLKVGDSTISFRYIGDWDDGSGSESDSENEKIIQVDKKFKIKFNNSDEFKRAEKYFKKRKD